MKPCPYCGAQIGEDNNFCTSCGQRVAPIPAAPVFEAAPAEPVFEAAPAAPVFEAAPAEPVFEAAPAAPVLEAAPAEPVFEAAPAEPVFETAPADPVFEAAPAAPAFDPTPAAPTYEEAPAPDFQQPAPEPQEEPQEPETDYGYSSNPFPAPAPVPQKKSKKKLVVWIIVAVLLIGIGIGAYFVASWYFSPEQKVLRMVEAKDYTNAQILVTQNMNLRYNMELENLLVNKLEAVKTAFAEKTMDHAAAISEVDAIEKLEVENLKAKIPQYRDYINNVNQSRADMATAEKFFAEGNYPEALTNFRKVIKDDPDFNKATQRIIDTINAYRTKVLADAAKEAETGAFDSAVTVIDGGLVVLPDDADLLAQKKAYQQDHLNSLKNAALSQAAEAAEAKDYIQAMAILDAHTGEHGEDADVVAKRAEYLETYVDSILAQADDLQNKNDFVGADKAISDALNAAPDHARLLDRRKALIAACIEYTLAETDKLMEEAKYEDALKLVSDALLIAPEEETLTARKTLIEDKMGRWFVDLLTPYEDSGYRTATFQMSGQDCLYGFYLLSNSYAMWNLNGEYKALSFDLGHVDGSAMATCTVSVYCDGNLKESFVVQPDALPQYYEINVEGVKQLKISVKDYDIFNTWTGFANVKIYK